MTDPDEQFRRLTATRNGQPVTPHVVLVHPPRDTLGGWLYPHAAKINALLQAPAGWQFRGVEPVIRLWCHTVYTARYTRIADGYAVECEGDTAGAAVVRALKFVAEAGNEPTLQLPLGDTDNG